MHTRGDTAPADGAAGIYPLLTRAACSLGYLAAAVFLCWRMTTIREASAEQALVPEYLCLAAATVLTALAVVSLLRRPVREEGPS
jgi:hypothetical protein